MTAKEYLSEFQQIENKLHAKKKRVENLKKRAVNLRGVNYEDVRVQTSRNTDGAFSFVDEAVDLEQEYLSDYCAYLRRWQEMEDFIFHIENFGQLKVVLDRYIEGKSLSSIAKDTNRTYERVRYLHCKGMKQLQDLWDEYDGQPDKIPSDDFAGLLPSH